MSLIFTAQCSNVSTHTYVCTCTPIYNNLCLQTNRLYHFLFIAIASNPLHNMLLQYVSIYRSLHPRSIYYYHVMLLMLSDWMCIIQNVSVIIVPLSSQFRTPVSLWEWRYVLVRELYHTQWDCVLMCRELHWGTLRVLWVHYANTLLLCYHRTYCVTCAYICCINSFHVYKYVDNLSLVCGLYNQACPCMFSEWKWHNSVPALSYSNFEMILCNKE